MSTGSASKEALHVTTQQMVDKDNLIEEKESDASLHSFWEYAKEGQVHERHEVKVSFEVKKGVLHRIYLKQDEDKLSQVKSWCQESCATRY